MSEQPQSVEGESASDDSEQSQASIQVPPFAPSRFQNQMGRDTGVRWAIFGSLVVVIFATMFTTTGESMAVLPMVIVAVAWVGIGMVSTRVAQRLHRVAELIHRDPARAEELLADLISRWPLHRSVRVLLYHRLAMLRHRQQRYAETSAICQVLLRQSLGMTTNLMSAPRGTMSAGADGADGMHDRAGGLRTHILLMLAESRLRCGDLAGAWTALSQLHSAPVSLIESLQRLALQTQYEIAAGQYDAALAQIEHKIRLAELMPAPQCGAIHSLLADAAEYSGRERLATWLNARADLLTTAEQRDVLLGNARA